MAGIVLVVIGVVVLLARLADMALGSSSWPLWIIVPGLAMLVGSLAIPPRAGLGLAIPGTIIAIVGGILWVQDTYDLYATWAYAWALVAPTGPGLAMLIYGLARGDRELAADGFRTTLVGLGLFLGFALFFEGVVGMSGHQIANLDEVLPVHRDRLRACCSWWPRCSAAGAAAVTRAAPAAPDRLLDLEDLRTGSRRPGSRSSRRRRPAGPSGRRPPARCSRSVPRGSSPRPS